MTTTLIDQVLSLGITVLGVFIALLLDNIVTNQRSRNKFRKALNTAFIDLQNNISCYYSFIVGIDKNVKPFIQNPPGGFLEKNLPDFVQLLDFILSNEDLVKYTSSKNVISLLKNKKSAKTFYSFLADYKSLGNNNNVKIALNGIIQEYQKLSMDIINMFYSTELIYTVEDYLEIMKIIGSKKVNSIYLKKNDKNIKNILKCKKT